ncbi:MAG: type II secretion system GspH family protein [Firmicutes bacterium]|nr:type II secretion system GspH family protein [Bacillota bacterium]
MKNEKNKGFALLEVVFAFAILELALLAIISAFPSLTKLNRSAWQVSVAAQLAQEKMEEIKSDNHFLWEPSGITEDKDMVTAAAQQSPPARDNFNPDMGDKYWICTCGTENNASVVKCTKCNKDMPAMLTNLPDCTRVWWGEKDPGGNSNLQIIKVKIMWTDGKIKRSKTLSALYYL